QSRIKWNPDLKAPPRERIQCRSLDMAMPVDAEQAAAIGAGPTCAQCPFRQFTLDNQGHPQKAACSEYENLAVAFADDEEPIPYHVGVKSTGLKPIRAFLQQWKAVAVAKRARGVPPFAIVFELRRGPQAGEGALTYYPIAARLAGELVPQERWPALAVFQRIIAGIPFDTTAQVVDEEPVPPDGDGGIQILGDDELEWRRDAESTPPAPAPVPPIGGAEAAAAAKARFKMLCERQGLSTQRMVCEVLGLDPAPGMLDRYATATSWDHLGRLLERGERVESAWQGAVGEPEPLPAEPSPKAAAAQ
ncbi:MAG TPA: hypothetical protein VFA70_02115, partial [Dehalococcoidia bacterium]|nr:hypothetical protein [Dehalococcoidia bacterium]